MARRKKSKSTEPAKPSAKGSRRVLTETEPEGLTYTEGAERIADDLENEPGGPLEGGEYPTRSDRRDPEEVAERRRKARESGELRDAAESIEDVLEGAELEGLEDLPGADDPEGESDDDGDEPDPDESDEGDEPDPEDFLDLDELGDRLVEIKIDGETRTVPLSEAIGAGIREKTWTKRTQELAEQRKEAAQVRANAAAIAEQYRQGLEFISRTFEQSLTPSQRQAVTAAYQKAVADQEAIQAHALQERTAEENAKLAEALGWSNDEEATAGKSALVTAAQEHYGFAPEDLGAVYDHRVLLVLDDARRYRELVARQEEVRGDLRKSRRTSATLKPGQPKPKGDKGKRARQQNRDRLRREGSLQAGAAAIADLIDD